MNFQQLKIIREAARCHFNLTEVANTLYTSQSGVSRHIKELEDELGVELFIRRGKRLLGMTEPGKFCQQRSWPFTCFYDTYAGALCLTGHHQRIPHTISASATGTASGQSE